VKSKKCILYGLVFFNALRKEQTEGLLSLKFAVCIFEQIREEFHRITNKNRINNFRAGLNQHTSSLLKLYQARRTAFPAEMDQLLNKLDEEVKFRLHHLIIAL